MAKKRKKVQRSTPVHGARAVASKNKTLARSYKKPPVPPIPAVHIGDTPVRLIVNADVPVKLVRRQTWMEYLFGVTKT